MAQSRSAGSDTRLRAVPVALSQARGLASKAAKETTVPPGRKTWGPQELASSAENPAGVGVQLSTSPGRVLLSWELQGTQKPQQELRMLPKGGRTSSAA